MFDNLVARFGPGLNNTVNIKGGTGGIFSDMYVPDRIGKVHEGVWDWDQFVAGDWASTANGGSIALTAGDGGLLALTTVATASTPASLQKTPAAFQMVSGYRAWFRSTAKLDSLLGNTIQGLVNVTTTPFTGGSITDGIWFTTSVTTGEVFANLAVAGSVTSVDMGTQIVAAQNFTLAWYYDGGVYTAPAGRVVFEATTGPTGVGGVTGAARIEIALPTGTTFPGATLLVPTLGVNPSTAAARTLTSDILYVAKDRSNINATPALPY